MSEDEHEDAEGEEGGGGKESGEAKSGGLAGKKKLIIIIALALLVAIGAAAGAYFTGMADPLLAMLGAGGGAPAEEHAASSEGGGPEGTVFYDLPEMTVNLDSLGRKKAYLKIRVALALATPEDTAIVEAVMPRIVDNFQVYLRELRVDDLQGAAGMYRLREELLSRVIAASKPARVSDVLFKEMLVQ
ncbi:MAG: flagellar basal body protein FliL [Alphaproteobacteria bacterium RIFOXYD12_FULL_60_8]|nr:MAG: flagellar basal body protein FliL [Alphaproteobacteria bacterium RIFOXYD12_FULL_60_8]